MGKDLIGRTGDELVGIDGVFQTMRYAMVLDLRDIISQRKLKGVYPVKCNDCIASKLLLAVFIISAPISTFANKKQTVKVTLAEHTEDRAFKIDRGLIRGEQTDNEVFMVNVIINGEHVRLSCDENHRGCTALGPGTYDGELQNDNVWIRATVPLTHKVVRDHWKIEGSW